MMISLYVLATALLVSLVVAGNRQAVAAGIKGAVNGYMVWTFDPDLNMHEGRALAQMIFGALAGTAVIVGLLIALGFGIAAIF